jgi:transposase InsO family protein
MEQKGEISTDDYIAIFMGKMKPPFSFRVVQKFITRYMNANPIEKSVVYLGIDKTKSQLEKAHGSHAYRASYRNEAWELDSTPLDAIIKVDDKQERYAVLGCIDLFTGRRVMMVVDRSNAHNLTRFFWLCVMVLGLPRKVYLDNGRDYASKQFEGLLDGLNVSIIRARAYSGRDKGHIERAFRTLSHSILPTLPSYIGHNVATRQSIEESRDKQERAKGSKGRKTNQDYQLNLEEINAAIALCCKQWDMCGMYNRRVPLEAWNADTRPIYKIAYNDFLMHAGERWTRTVGKKGILLRGRTYTGLDLARVTGEVEIRENIDDVSEMFVFSPSGEYLGMAFDAQTRPQTKEEARLAERIVNKEFNNVKAFVREAEKYNAQGFGRELLERQKEVVAAAYLAYLKQEDYQLGSKGAKEAIDDARRRDRLNRAFPTIPIPQTATKPRKRLTWESAIAKNG